MTHLLYHFTHVPALDVYAFLIIWLAAESLGVPLPDEAVLLTVGFLAHRGTVDLVPAIASAVLGAAIGSSISYAIGMRLGRPVVAGITARLHLKPDRLVQAELWMRRRGGVGVFLTRVLPVARNLASYAAGIAGIPPKVFYAGMLSGTLLWTVTVVVIGDALGDHYRAILRIGGPGLLIAIGLALGAIGVWLAFSALRSRSAKA